MRKWVELVGMWAGMPCKEERSTVRLFRMRFLRIVGIKG